MSKTILFVNLEKELATLRTSKKEFALYLGFSPTTLYLKLKGKREFTLLEMEKAASFIEIETGQRPALDYLFKKSH